MPRVKEKLDLMFLNLNIIYFFFIFLMTAFWSLKFVNIY